MGHSAQNIFEDVIAGRKPIDRHPATRYLEFRTIGGTIDSRGRQQLFKAFENAGLVAVGTMVIGFARPISRWEKRLSDKHPSTRVTGWSGTWRGILAWRQIGAIPAAMELFQLVLNPAHR